MIRMTITTRLFVTMLTACAIVVVCVLFLVHWSLDRGFLRYVNNLEQERLSNLVAQLEEHYASSGSWQGLRDEPGRWHRLVQESHPDGLRRPPPPPLPTEIPPPPAPGARFDARLTLYDRQRVRILGPTDPVPSGELRPLRAGGEVVGYLSMLPRQHLSDSQQLFFIRQQRLILLVVGGVMLIVAALLAHLLSRRLLRPIRELADATRLLAEGHYQIRVPSRSGDELGRLATDFNALATSLDRTEALRREWVADTSHELRTPLAILRGEIEALLDGVRPANHDNLASLHSEVLRLGRLVDDLYQLALADVGALTYRQENLELGPLLAAEVAAFAPACAGRALTVTVAGSDQPLVVHADRQRLQQLCSNLLDNAVKYTDPGGEIMLRLARVGDQALLEVCDSAPGVAAEVLPRLFDRFYRVEGSRNRASGGAGLGLALCRSIVTAHGGNIAAAPSPLGGVTIRIVLPLVPEAP